MGRPMRIRTHLVWAWACSALEIATNTPCRLMVSTLCCRPNIWSMRWIRKWYLASPRSENTLAEAVAGCYLQVHYDILSVRYFLEIGQSRGKMPQFAAFESSRLRTC